jgi:hypothetical protein
MYHLIQSSPTKKASYCKSQQTNLVKIKKKISIFTLLTCSFSQLLVEFGTTKKHLQALINE